MAERRVAQPRRDGRSVRRCYHRTPWNAWAPAASRALIRSVDRRGPPLGVPAVIGGASVAAGLLSADWIAAAAIWVLWAGWRYLRASEGPPVLAMAFTFQWVQVTAGIWYDTLTGIRLPALDLSDYRPAVLIGLGCLVALLVGLKLGMGVVPLPRASAMEARTGLRMGGRSSRPTWSRWPSTGAVQELAWEVPSLTQGILALTYARFALLFLMFRRLSQPRVRIGWISAILAGEVILGFTGYFAGFREPMMMAAMAITGAFDRRRIKHWAVLGTLGLVMLLSGVIWMGIRTEYRRDFEDQVFATSRDARLDRIAALSSRWIDRSPREIVSDVDLFVDRLWAVYYPALAPRSGPVGRAPRGRRDPLGRRRPRAHASRALPRQARRRVGQRESAPVLPASGWRGARRTRASHSGMPRKPTWTSGGA